MDPPSTAPPVALRGAELSRALGLGVQVPGRAVRGSARRAMSAVEARVALLRFGEADAGPASLRGDALDAVLRRLREI